ncbi:MAG: hypothetical protein U0793_06075 [Gemmataceae bacterium]
MHEAIVFGEDVGHEIVLVGLMKRLADEAGVELTVRVRSASGGHGKMLAEVSRFLHLLRKAKERSPDLVVVGRDANCQGYGGCRKSLESATGEGPCPIVYALPDPHIERWLLSDGGAFRKVVGRGCTPPREKCDRDRYKKLLNQAVRDAGLQPLQGGLEYAEEIVRTMDLSAGGRDKSLQHFLTDARAALHLLRRE